MNLARLSNLYSAVGCFFQCRSLFLSLFFYAVSMGCVCLYEFGRNILFGFLALPTNYTRTQIKQLQTWFWQRKIAQNAFFRFAQWTEQEMNFWKVCGKVSLVYIKPLIFVHIFVNLQNVGFFGFVFFLSFLSKNIHVFFCAQGTYNSIQWWKKSPNSSNQRTNKHST